MTVVTTFWCEKFVPRFDYFLFVCIVKTVENKNFKGSLSGLRQFLATKSPLKMMKNAFHFTLKALFVLKIFKFLS